MEPLARVLAMYREVTLGSPWVVAVFVALAALTVASMTVTRSARTELFESKSYRAMIDRLRDVSPELSVLGPMRRIDTVFGVSVFVHLSAAAVHGAQFFLAPTPAVPAGPASSSALALAGAAAVLASLSLIAVFVCLRLGWRVNRALYAWKERDYRKDDGKPA
jgi:hypothetical protein